MLDEERSSSSSKGSSSSVLDEERSSSSSKGSSSSVLDEERSSSSSKGSSSSVLDEERSSSSSQSSSSLATVEMCKVGTEDHCEYEILVDNRDGKSYRTVKIGNQEWMAENLAYECDSLKPWNRSVCHQDPDTCAKYGRLYFWGAAMDSLKTGCGYGTRCSPQFPVHGICPEGWHIPSREEIVILLKNVGDASGLNLRTTNSWTKPRKCNGNDGYGFSALPAGYYIGGDSSPFARINTEADILLSDEYDKNRILILQIIGPASVSGCNRIAEIYQLWNKSDAASVRCIKD